MTDAEYMEIKNGIVDETNAMEFDADGLRIGCDLKYNDLHLIGLRGMIDDIANEGREFEDYEMILIEATFKLQPKVNKEEVED